ncbi:MAG: acyl-CoA dehydrogenase family protein [Acidimicrobiales bacterium]
MEQPGRSDLEAWRAAKPGNFFSARPDLGALLDQYVGAGAVALTARLESFGRSVVEVIDPAVEVQERSREYPRLRPFDEVGRRVEEVEFHPAERRAADAAWGSGMLATRLDYIGAFDVAAHFFLLSHVGEGGQACPIVCTIGLRRAIEHHASAELKERYLPGLTATDASVALRGSQFLTEVQGGSDVGANATCAEPDPAEPGTWRLDGEKWFCSVADADLFAVTARRAGAGSGTGGLGCFLVPRSLDGAPNGFRIRRLKDKLGTRVMASAEIEFEGARAFPIGDPTHGFKIAVGDLLNTSRWLNAVGSAGIMSRAYLEASTFARYRRAFGRLIGDYPAVGEQLATMRMETAAAVASTFALTELVAKIDGGLATPDEVKVHRFLVNANKYLTSIAATDIVHQGIEILGGNGTIEDFSPLPRLYRDSIVFESWEGTHNVLCNQVRRDCARLGLLEAVADWVRRALVDSPAALAGPARQTARALERLQPPLHESLRDADLESAGFRRQLTELTRVIQAACLLREAAHHGAADEKGELAARFVECHLGTGEDRAGR